MPYKLRPLIEGICTNCRERPVREGLNPQNKAWKRCVECYATAKKWHEDNPEVRRKAKAKFKENHPRSETFRKRAQRKLAIENYGGKCECCGEGEFVFLAIDHIDGIKTEPYERKLRADRLAAWLINNNYPAGYRVLCNNCNYAVRFGPCPHQEKLV